MVHCSIRLYLRVEVIDDGSETKEGNFQRTQEQLRDAAEIPYQSEQVHMEPVLQEIPSSPQSTVCFAKSRFPDEVNADPEHKLTGNCKHRNCPTHVCICPSRHWTVLATLAGGIAGSRLQIALCSRRVTANLAITAPSCSGNCSSSVSPDILWNFVA